MGESGGSVVLVFDAAKAKQTLTDEEALALHAQLGLMLSTRARRNGTPVPATSPVNYAPAPIAADHMAPVVNPVTGRPGPVPATRRKPMIGPDSDAPLDVAALLADAGDDGKAAMAEAERRDREQVEAQLAESQRKRRAKARAAAGLPPEEDEEVPA